MLDQLVVGAAPGDAITQSALLVQESLSQLGPSNMYAEHREEHMVDRVHSLAELRVRPNRERPLVFHASMGSEPVFDALADEPELLLVYHNFSPAEYFDEFAPEVARDLRRGRWELEQLRPRVRAAVADSDYNADELRELGYTDVVVVPPTPDVERLLRTTPDVGLLSQVDQWGPGPLVLCVAQQLPHKRIERVVAAVAELQQEYLPGARLVYVGVGRFEPYTRALRAMASSVGLHDPKFMGRLTDEQLAALYLRADVFLTLTEHEGYCVPVIEAMAAGVPVVASARAALPGTVGSAGVLVADPDDPQLAAALLNRVLTDDDLRRRLVGRGSHRARSMAAPVSLPKLVETLVSAGRRPVRQSEAP